MATGPRCFGGETGRALARFVQNWTKTVLQPADRLVIARHLSAISGRGSGYFRPRSRAALRHDARRLRRRPGRRACRNSAPASTRCERTVDGRIFSAAVVPATRLHRLRRFPVGRGRSAIRGICGGRPRCAPGRGASRPVGVSPDAPRVRRLTGGRTVAIATIGATCTFWRRSFWVAAVLRVVLLRRPRARSIPAAARICGPCPGTVLPWVIASDRAVIAKRLRRDLRVYAGFRGDRLAHPPDAGHRIA